MTENHFRSHFSSFQINTQLFIFLKLFHKMAAAGHFGLPKITVSHFSPFQINTRVFFIIFSHFGWPKITFDRIYRHFRSIQNFSFFGFFFNKMATIGHFRWLKITFNRISRHFRSIRNFFGGNLSYKVAVLDPNFCQNRYGPPSIVGQWLHQIWNWSVHFWLSYGMHKLFHHIFTKWPLAAIWFFLIISKIDRVLPL